MGNDMVIQNDDELQKVLSEIDGEKYLETMLNSCDNSFVDLYFFKAIQT